MIDAITYEVHGLAVRSQIDLPERRGSGAPDIEIFLADVRSGSTRKPPCAIVAALDPDEGGYAISQTDGGYVIRWPDVCEFDLAGDLAQVGVSLASAGDSDGVATLITGNLLGFILTMRGEIVLHASAVRVDGATLAITGASGMGKSTVTALLCAAGALLVSDDLLRLDLRESGRVECYLGTSEIRLRPAAAELARQFPSAETRQTPDGRLAIRVPVAEGPRVRLDAILIPRPDRTRSELSVARLSPRSALLELIRYPRILGWQFAEPLGRQLHALADIVETIPVYVADIPWGPPFVPGLANEILNAVGFPGQPLAHAATTP